MNFEHLQIELTNHCNLKCKECPHRFMGRSQSEMNPDVFDAILNDYIIPIKPVSVILSKDGEPLLCKNIRIYIEKICSVSDVRMVIYTNGLLLGEDFVSFLSKFKNKFQLLVSFHYEQIPPKDMTAIYDKVGKKLKNCINMKCSNIEFIIASHILTNSDMPRLQNWKNRWDEVKLSSKNLTGVHLNANINPWAGLIKEGTVKFETCPYGCGSHFFIGVTGNVLPCCMDLEEELAFGNVLKDNVSDLLNRKNQFYFNVNQKINLSNLCKRCLA